MTDPLGVRDLVRLESKTNPMSSVSPDRPPVLHPEPHDIDSSHRHGEDGRR